MVRLIGDDGVALPLPGLLDRCVGLPRKYRELGWHVLPESREISVPAVAATLEAVSGLEFESAKRSLDLSGRQAHRVTLDLNRIPAPGLAGWVAGNTHLHLKDLTREEADRYLREVSRADGLSVVFVSYLERALVDRTYITNEHTRTDLAALSTEDVQFGNGEEYRHNIDGGGEGYGHVMLLDVAKRILPASVGPGITKQGFDDDPLRDGILAARDQSATVVWCHNGFGFEDIPNWIEGRVDAQNIFDGGNRGSYGDTFYRYLDLGMKVPFSTGTDWFVYDFSRVYARLDEGRPPSVDAWLDALRAGSTFITNGPLLQFHAGEKGAVPDRAVPDWALPGESISLESAGSIPVSGSAVSRHDFGRLEVVQNGEVVASSESYPVDGHFVAEIEATVPCEQSGWVALRVQPDPEVRNEFDRPLFAHTSAVSVLVAGKPIFNSETARGLIAEIKSDQAKIAEGGSFSSEVKREQVLDLYRAAVADLERRLARKGGSP
jgi:hypothetical protein